jgi:dTDP-4-amino-4,6-dideoxygalactose transaminase
MRRSLIALIYEMVSDCAMNSVVTPTALLPFFADRVQREPLYVARSVAPDSALLLAHIEAMARTARYSNFGPCHQALTDLLENELAADAVSLFSSATAALITVLRAMEINGEVITTPFTFAGTAHAVTWAGATPVFADIHSSDMTLDPARVEAAITPRTQAILAVHIYGIPCDVKALADIAARHRLMLVYDAAHAFTTRIAGIPVHRFGDATVYSLHASKLFHTGEGGALVCRSHALQAKCQRLQNFGFDGDGEIIEPGSNAKLSEMQAALGLSVYPGIAAERDARVMVRRTYEHQLQGIAGVQLVSAPANVSSSHQYLVIRVDGRDPATGLSNRDVVHDVLKQHQIFSRRYFYPLCSEFAHYAKYPNAAAHNLPNALRISREVLCLPLHSNVNATAIGDICFLIKHVMHRLIATSIDSSSQ